MISIIGDVAVEDTESFSVSLTSKDNAVTLAQSSTSVTIQGDDSKMYKFQQKLWIVFCRCILVVETKGLLAYSVSWFG